MFDYFLKADGDGYMAYYNKVEASQIPLTKIFYKDLEYRCRIPTEDEDRPQRSINLHIFSSAKSGSGKSMIGMSVQKHIMDLNNIELEPEKHIHFTTIDVINAMKEHAVQGSCFLLDETRSSEQFGVGSRAYMSKITDVVNVSRAFGLSFIRISQEYEKRKIASHYVLDALKINYPQRKNMALVMTTDGKYYGRVILPAIEDNELLEKYEKRKMQFIQRTITQNETGKSQVQTKLAKQLAEHPDFAFAKNNDERFIVAQNVLGSEIPNKLMKLIISEARMIFRMKEEGRELESVDYSDVNAPSRDEDGDDELRGF